MNSKEFFYLVANMRSAQKAYFANKSQVAFRACRALENDVDREIARVKDILSIKQLEDNVKSVSEA